MGKKNHMKSLKIVFILFTHTNLVGKVKIFKTHCLTLACIPARPCGTDHVLGYLFPLVRSIGCAGRVGQSVQLHYMGHIHFEGTVKRHSPACGNQDSVVIVGFRLCKADWSGGVIEENLFG